MPRISEIVARGFVAIAYVALSSLPFVYAMSRLQSVTGQTPLTVCLKDLIYQVFQDRIDPSNTLVHIFGYSEKFL